MAIQIIFFDKKPEITGRLNDAFAGQPSLSAQQLMPSEIAAHEALDAMYLPLMAAERWGSKPLYNQSQVLETNANKEEWPRFIVAGIAFHPDDVRADDPLEVLKLTISAVMEAVDAFNMVNGSPIKTIGFWTENVGIHRMDPYMAGRFIRSVYENRQQVES